MNTDTEHHNLNTMLEFRGERASLSQLLFKSLKTDIISIPDAIGALRRYAYLVSDRNREKAQRASKLADYVEEQHSKFDEGEYDQDQFISTLRGIDNPLLKDVLIKIFRKEIN
jgi:hypothetical protein